VAERSKQQLGDSLAARLGIEVREPRPVPQHEPEAVEASEVIADFLCIAPEDLKAAAKPSAHASFPQTGIDRALSIADRVAAGAQLSDADCTFLWSDPELIPVFNKRLELERAIAKGKRG